MILNFLVFINPADIQLDAITLRLKEKIDLTA